MVVLCLFPRDEKVNPGGALHSDIWVELLPASHHFPYPVLCNPAIVHRAPLTLKNLDVRGAAFAPHE
jgi:hypothetical protein